MTFVRNAWYVAAWSGDIACEQVVGMHILDEPLVIWRNAAGRVSAFEDRCVHRLAPLSLGRCEGEKLRCLYHGLQFDCTGRVVGIPGRDRVAGNLRVRSYPVVEKHDWVWVWMGEMDADERLIPPVFSVNRPEYGGWLKGHAHIDYDVESFLVTDNIADISHVPFLHRHDPELDAIFKINPATFTRHERSVRTEWWMEMPRSPEAMEDRISQYARTDFHLPGVLITQDKYFPLGTEGALNGEAPTLDGEVAVSSHMITPMTKRSTRNFFSATWPRDYNYFVRDDVALMNYFLSVFAEDKKMLEAQQKNLDSKPGWRFISIATDRGIVLFNQLFDQQLREEANRVSGAS
jgi:vanillate O-demethylase monooxygenase subunit